ncbi:DHA2 family efflux MFS transporter permease subunit [Nocardia tengchongensis]|uniref:DHA2 family efflux MFS transporter permease subunit n=1 Tax=Nocardia tengchongensis TaxID=2055889 RepID=UPI0036B0A65A
MSNTDSRRVLWTFIVSGIAIFMVSLDNLVVFNALPTIRMELHTGLDGLQWIINSYTLTEAVLLLAGASLGDRFGRKRTFVVGLVIFTGASAACALSSSIGALIAARAVQGVGAAIVIPLTLTLLAQAVPPAKRGAAIGMWSAMSGLAVGLGPVVGGAITNYASWQWIFWINVPIGAVLIPLAIALVGESFGTGARLDLVGNALIALGLLGIVFGLIRGNDHGWTSAGVLGSLIGGALLLVVFVAWINRVAEPMVPPVIFTSRGFTLTAVAALGMSVGMFGAVFFLVQFLQTVQHYSALSAGVHTLAWTAMPTFTAPIAGILIDKIGGKPLLVVGLVLQAIGLGWLAAVTTPDVSYAVLVPCFVISGAGMGLFFPPIARLALEYVAPQFEGVASGVSSAIRYFGTVLGIAVLGAVFAAHGSYANRQAFTDGYVPTLWWACGFLTVSAIIAILLPRRPEHAAGGVLSAAAVAEPSIDSSESATAH